MRDEIEEKIEEKIEEIEEKIDGFIKDITEEVNQKEPRSAVRSGKMEMLRRAIHMSIPVALIYYLLPQDLWGLAQKETGLLFVFFALMISEIVRIKLKIILPGFRPYEAGRISAATWAGIGLFFSFLLFPMVLVVPAVITMAVVDPLNGEMRRSKYYPWVSGGVAHLIYILSFVLLGNFDPVTAVILGIIGGTVAMAAEIPHFWIDDDFMMIITPSVVLYPLIMILESLGIIA